MVERTHGFLKRGGRLLEQTDRGNAGRPCAKTLGSVLPGYTANGDDRNVQRSRDLRQAFDALRRAVVGLGRRAENRAEIDVIRARALRAQCCAKGMAGKANEKLVLRMASPEIFIAQSASLGDRKAVLAKVYASGSTSQGYVQTIIHQDSCGGPDTPDVFERFFNKTRPFFSRAVFFAELDPLDAGGRRVSDTV